MPDESPAKLVYRDLTQSALDAAYDQRFWTKNYQETIDRYQSEAARVSQQMPIRTLRYGPGPDETLDLYIPVSDGLLPLQVFIHGGAWLRGSRALYGFLAEYASSKGYCCAVLDFSPADKGGVSHMVEQVGLALTYLQTNAASLGFLPDAFHIIGHSSGAHLAACIITGCQGDYVKSLVQSAFLISGIYDLEPVVLSARGQYMGVMPAEVRQLSPIHNIAKVSCRIHLATGDTESPEFHRQTQAFSEALKANQRPYTFGQTANRDHFSILLDLLDPESELVLAGDRLFSGG